ncbi:carboxylesterase [Micromonospora sp. AMSO31t]|uniref:alpha/beta hydrolase n=1 Tax=Micromonospora sp. AMSO31t TaxID=2650566 RepID=UPI00124B4B23|nr:alpha/beta fold hydrolase [Micromonospora sp. AMSO31t]KAB1908771.1 alpha/beta fold hydrolase [Micromonospora sp. AMSO31t]
MTGPVAGGAVLLHGFAGSPSSMHPFARALAPHLRRVAVPVLRGHDTRWSDLRAVSWRDWCDDARAAVDDVAAAGPVAVIGLSMGGALALRLAAMHPAVSHVVLVNPSITMKNPLLPLLPVLRHVVPSIANERPQVRDPSVRYAGYRRIPLAAVQQMTRLWADVRPRLPAVTQPVRVFRSLADGPAGLRSVEVIRQGVRSADLVEVPLARSGHVATLDHDAELIFAHSTAFLTGRPAPPAVRPG